MASDSIQLDHGSGGRATHELIRELIAEALANPFLAEMNDSALLPALSTPLAMTTDCYVVDPIIFPGGDIGSLALHGTINDLAKLGARPFYLTAGFVLEEGLPLTTLRRVVHSMAEAARNAEVKVVAGDTKVVPRGKADKLFITTAGLGGVPPERRLGGQYAQPGDAVVINGTIGDHGMAILCKREGLAFENEIQSDAASLHMLVDQPLRPGHEGSGIGFRPPVLEIAVTVGLTTLVVEGPMADLVADHRPDAAVVDGVIGVQMEERGLQDGRRKDDLVQP